MEEEDYDLPDDVEDTEGLFDEEDEGKQDDEGLLDKSYSHANHLIDIIRKFLRVWWYSQ